MNITEKYTDSSLVSIVVITYNSSKFVLETLDSAKSQTYKNIELIITDDCSTDNTVEICNNWLSKNKEGFINTELITIDKNTGIPANCNRGVRKAKGTWIKIIAGDDALLNDCISINIEYINLNPDESIVFSFRRKYYETLIESNYLQTYPSNYPNNFINNEITANVQYNILLRRDPVNYSATSFIKKVAIEDVGFFDERFPFIEDYPMWLKLTKKGYKLNFTPFDTVKHRAHNNSVHNTTKKYLIKPSFIRNKKLLEEYTLPYLPLIYKFDFYFRFYISIILKIVFLNRSNRITRKISNILLLNLNPFNRNIKRNKK